MVSITPQAEAIVQIAGGVDTHADTHTAAVIDQVGRVLGTEQLPATGAGYAALLEWMRSFATIAVIGIVGSGAYGAGLAGHPREHGLELAEVDRPDRKTRRVQGKSDPIDPIDAVKPPKQRWPASAPPYPNNAMAASRPCGCCGWPAARRSLNGLSSSGR